MTKMQFKEAMNYVFLPFNKSLSDELLIMWYEDYKDYGYSSFMTAMRELVNKEDKVPRKSTIERYLNKGNYGGKRKFFQASPEDSVLNADLERTKALTRLDYSTMKDNFDLAEATRILELKESGQITSLEYCDLMEELTGVDYTSERIWWAEKEDRKKKAEERYHGAFKRPKIETLAQSEEAFTPYEQKVGEPF